MGCDAELSPGMVIAVPATSSRMTIIAEVSIDRARESAEALGNVLEVVPGERFYEVEVETSPIGGNN